MSTLRILTEEAVSQATVVNEFEQTLLRVFILIIMFGLGAGLTPKDFGLALRRPWGLMRAPTIASIWGMAPAVVRHTMPTTTAKHASHTTNKSTKQQASPT